MKVIEGKKMMVSASQIQFLLKESRDKAYAMVMLAKGSKNIFADMDIIKNPAVDVDVFDKYHKLGIQAAMEDIFFNALKRPAFKKYLLHDIPETALGKVFKDGRLPPKVIKLPSALKSLMNPADVQQVDEYWNKHFAGKSYLHHSDKDLKPNFKP